MLTDRPRRFLYQLASSEEETHKLIASQKVKALSRLYLKDNALDRWESRFEEAAACYWATSPN